MKSIVLKEIGGLEKLRFEEVETPTPAKGEVLVKLKYAALNRRDYFITKDLYPGIKLPSILGADGSGIVVELGEGIQEIEVGNEIVIHPGLNWGPNENCANPDYNILGMPVDGTYAQYVKVPAENVYSKPSYLTWEEAASFPLAGITAYRALITKGQIHEGENVLIPGIGSGVALLVLQMAVAKGANVYVTSSSDEKIEQAKQLGAIDGVNYRSEDWFTQLRKLAGSFSLIVDGVGGPSFNDLIRLTSPGGRIVSYGATNGIIPKFNLAKAFTKNVDIFGAAMGSPREFSQLLDFFEKYQIRPVIDRSFPLEQAKEALEYMEKGKNFGKITLEIPE